MSGPYVLADLEEELLEYIRNIRRRGEWVERETIRTFAQHAAGRPIDQTWVSRFIVQRGVQLSPLVSEDPPAYQFYDDIPEARPRLDQRHDDGNDDDRSESSSGSSEYSEIIEAFRSDILHFDVRSINLGTRIDRGDAYTLNEQGFMLDECPDSERIFSQWAWKRRYTTRYFDGQFDEPEPKWMAVMACICSDGTALRPTLGFSVDHRDQEAPCLRSSLTVLTFSERSPAGWNGPEQGVGWMKFSTPVRRRKPRVEPVYGFWTAEGRQSTRILSPNATREISVLLLLLRGTVLYNRSTVICFNLSRLHT